MRAADCRPAAETPFGFAAVLKVDGAGQHFQVIRLKDHLAVGVHIHLHACPVGVDVAVLLDENVVEYVVGHAVRPGLRDSGIGQGLVVGHVQALVGEVETVSHTAAVQPHVGEVFFQIPQNGVLLLLVEVFRGGFGVVVPELDGDIIGQKPLHIVRELLGWIVFIQHAVDARGAGDAGDDLVRRLFHILHQMPGDIHACYLVLVFFGESQHVLRRAVGLHGEGGVDIDFMSGGDSVQHLLQSVQIRQRLAAGEHEVTFRGDGVHGADAAENSFQAKSAAVGVFFFIDTKRAVVGAVVGHENRDGGAAYPGLIGMAH